jgi:hypothetical protein
VKPVCVPCQRFFRPKTNGFYFTEAMPIGNDAEPGTVAPEKWTPYKTWVGDLWECQDCGAQVVVGVPSSPINEHYKPDFQEQRIALRADQLIVNDC